MTKGTIIYIGSFKLPDNDAASHRVLSNAKIFRELGYKTVFISANQSIDYHKSNKFTRCKIMDFETWFIPYPKTNTEWINYLYNISSFIEVFGHYKDVKIVICYNYPAYALKKIAAFCRKRKIKILSDCTEWYSIRNVNVIRSIIKGLDTFLRMRIIQKNIDGIIVISKYLEKYYKKYLKVIRLPPLVDLSEKKWEKIILQKIPDKKYFVYAGHPGRHKDKINIIIQAFAKINNMRNYIIYIIGIDKNQYLNMYKKDQNILDELNNNIVFLGRISHRESLDYIKSADFSIFFREKNRVTKAGFPTKFVESVSCGIPSITTNNSDLHEYVIHKKNGFLLKYTKENNIYNDIKYILSLSNSEICQYKQNCININTFDYRNYIKVTEKFIQAILNINE